MTTVARRESFEWPDIARRFFDSDWRVPTMRVEEYRDGQDLVVKAEMPGIDPDKDVEITVADGVLHISAEREEKSEHKDKDSYRSEFTYGSFVRDIALPSGAKEDDVRASYTDGVLEVRVAVPVKAATKSKIPVTRK